MATVICPQLEAHTSTFPAWGEASSTTGGIEYGSFWSSIIGNRFVWAWVYYDISALLRSNIVSVHVVRNRTNNTAQAEGSPGIDYHIRLFWSRIANNPTPWPAASSNIVTGWNASFTRDAVPSGTIRQDITGIFHRDHIVQSVGGVIGLIFQGWASYNGVATASSSHLEVVTSPMPSLSPIDITPTTIQNPNRSVRFTWAHNPNPNLLLPDPLTGSQIELWQGAGPAISRTIEGQAGFFDLPGTTVSGATPVTYRIRTRTQFNGWGTWSTNRTFPLGVTPALAPTNLLPTTAQNPRGAIIFSWWHTPNPEVTYSDPQISSQVEVWQVPGNVHTMTIAGASNTGILPANFYTVYAPVTFRVRTGTNYNAWSPWSATATFGLQTTPPLAPTLVFPVGVSVVGESGVLLELGYNSPFDTTPTRFDVLWRRDGGDWVEVSNTGQLSVMTAPIVGQSTIEWQARAYGALGDVGPWSEIARFFTIGAPPAPTIVNVTNSNMPTIAFSGLNILSWEMEILHGTTRIYHVPSHAFTGGFSYTLSDLIANGHYTVRMRVTNQYGLTSGWGSRPFTIWVTQPTPLHVQIVSNLDFYIRLHFNNTDMRRVLIYRAEFDSGEFVRIALTRESMFDDYSAAPSRRYKYFIRVVNADFSFADSNIVTGRMTFMQTTIAQTSTMHDLTELVWQIDGRPTKARSHQFEKTLTQFVGRKSPVLQVGEHSSKSLSLSFYCDPEVRERLEQLNESADVLILRDWRLGAIFGVIDGQLSDSPTADGTVVSFVFRETDYIREVAL